MIFLKILVHCIKLPSLYLFEMYVKSFFRREKKENGYVFQVSSTPGTLFVFAFKLNLNKYKDHFVQDLLGKIKT